MNKREFIKSVAFSASALSFMGLTTGFRSGNKKWDGKFTVPSEVPGYGELYPFAGASDIKSHLELHSKYAEDLNLNVRELGIRGISTIEMFKNIDRYPVSLKENAGGFFNHKFFWRVISPKGNNVINGEILKAVKSDFVSFDIFKKEFLHAGMSVFGSGWLWLIYINGGLKITSTAGNDNPLMNTASEQGRPLLCLDLWEHAWDSYHVGDREAYINSFWKVADWSFVERRYKGFLRQEGSV